LMREQARSVTIEAQPTLKSLLEQARIADQVITWGEPEPDWDQQIEIIELPRVFRTTVPSIPNQVPYLNVPCDRQLDTMKRAHLAGAIGRPVWTLLPYRCDWRWMMKRGDSPWYPTMRLFRQERPGDWRTVIRQLERALRILVSQTNLECHPSRQSSPSHPIAA